MKEERGESKPQADVLSCRPSPMLRLPEPPLPPFLRKTSLSLNTLSCLCLICVCPLLQVLRPFLGRERRERPRVCAYLYGRHARWRRDRFQQSICQDSRGYNYGGGNSGVRTSTSRNVSCRSRSKSDMRGSNAAWLMRAQLKQACFVRRLSLLHPRWSDELESNRHPQSGSGRSIVEWPRRGGRRARAVLRTGNGSGSCALPFPEFTIR